MYTENADRKVVSDQRFTEIEADKRYDNIVFVRLSAKGKMFRNVDFRYTTFDACYFRDAKFDSCDFTGCRFIASNFHGAKFSGCRFEYAHFERTVIDPIILNTESPSRENLRVRFARSLRMNYQQLGDAAAVNKAIAVELEATQTHLYKAWTSEEDYYRKKYTGILWWKAVYKWFLFWLGDFVWGNGENSRRLLRFVLLILFVMTIYDVLSFGNAQLVKSYSSGVLRSVEVFMGVSVPDVNYPKLYLAFATVVRLVTIGFLLSIVIKRLGRR